MNKKNVLIGLAILMFLVAPMLTMNVKADPYLVKGTGTYHYYSSSNGNLSDYLRVYCSWVKSDNGSIYYTKTFGNYTQMIGDVSNQSRVYFELTVDESAFFGHVKMILLPANSDYVMICKSFGYYNIDYDLNNDSKINMRDIAIAIQNFNALTETLAS